MRYRLFFFIAASVVALGISGCAGEGKSYDPLGTDSLTFGDSSGSAVLQLDANGAVLLTAKVKNAAGKEVAEREVIFEFVANASGATLSSTKVNTNAAGEATILYRAGTTAGSDVIRAFISNGARMDVSITVGGGAGTQIALAAAPASLVAGQSSILTATVTNSAGSPVRGQTVTFVFSPNGNNSGATLTTLNGTTDVSGRAVALYRAGAANPTASVEDTVQASVAGSVSPVTITRAAVGGVQIALAAAPTSLAAGQNSILTATVTDGTGSPVIGQTVAFAFSANRSGGTLTTLSGTTDVSGRAVAVYTAGAANPTSSVEDTVQASAAGSVGAVTISRGGGGVTLSIAASATSVAAGQIAIITATVTDGASAPVSGQAVAFVLSTNNSGAALITLSGTTDATGKAIAQYTAGTNSPAASVNDTVLASVPGAAAAVVITRTVAAPTGFQIGVTATPASVAAGATSIIVATVTNANGTAASGQAVTFSFAGGAAPSGATLSRLNGGITDAGGKALAVYTAGAANPSASVQDTVVATVPGAVAATVITRQAATATGNRISSLTATPPTLLTTSGTSAVRATVVGSDGVTPVPGVTVTFSLSRALGLGTIAPQAVLTNASGQADAIFTGPGGAIGAADNFNIVQAQILGTTGGVAVVIINWP